jgi:dihydrofolate reductase
MIKPILSHVVILSENRVIAAQGRVPWKIPEDLKRFKQITFGHPVIMGRKTFEAIGKPLHGRLNIVVSRSKQKIAGVIFAGSIDMAIELAKRSGYETSEICIIGGGEIFNQTISMVDKLYLTIVHESIPGEVFYPDYSAFKQILFKHEGQVNGHIYTFVDLGK